MKEERDYKKLYEEGFDLYNNKKYEADIACYDKVSKDSPYYESAQMDI